LLSKGRCCLCGSFGHEPDVQISRIRLSDKTSRLHPRHVVPNMLAPSS
jgi:hypothetical protein